jgi:hypothetical protein
VTEASSIKLGHLGAGSHRVDVTDDHCLVVEWYDFGDDVPYESANILTFSTADQEALAEAMGLPGVTLGDLQSAVAERFASYWDVRAFCDQHHVPYRHDVDFMP